MSIEDRYQELRAAYDAKAVGFRVRVLRQILEMSQSGMARHLGIRSNTVSQFESGISRPAPDIAIRMKAASRIGFDWLYFGEMSGLDADMIRQIEQATVSLRAGAGRASSERSTTRRLVPRKRATPKK